jgi:hypothetical protein
MQTAFTLDQVEARHKVYAASQADEGVTLTAAEVKALWQTILETGREISRYRGLREAANELGVEIPGLTD